LIEKGCAAMASSVNGLNDNRNYDYAESGQDSRAEFDVIVNMIKAQSRVADLGCGNGVLLGRAIKEKGCTGTGIELTPSGGKIAQSRGLDVRTGRIDEPLPFKDSEFDYAICNVTIQMVLYPEILLQEMKRIARFQIISFPNFGFYKNRIDLLVTAGCLARCSSVTIGTPPDTSTSFRSRISINWYQMSAVLRSKSILLTKPET
jgi:SAM-dependent methyltransferase